MPELGETKLGRELGFSGGQKRIWAACVDCGKERWVTVRKGEIEHPRCPVCANTAERSSRWKGGRFKMGGYMFITVNERDFFYPMAQKNGVHTGYIAEHRLVMAQSLGRCLQSFEHTHHKNGIRDDNRKENLEIGTNSEHHTAHTKGYKDGFVKGYADGRSKHIKELERELQDVRTLSFNQN